MVPPGVWLTGALHLKSNINLYLAAGATVKFSTDPKDYPPLVLTRWEDVECMNYSPLIYAFEAQNVAVTGSGTLDGQANDVYWWPWKGKTNFGWREGMANQAPARKKLFAMGDDNTPVAERLFGEGSYLRSNFFEPYRCKDVVIEGCSFNCGDDCIAIKAGHNGGGRRVGAATENVVIRGCTTKDGHSGVTIGSEITSGVHNVFAEDCRMDSPDLWNAIRIKNNANRGGSPSARYRTPFLPSTSITKKAPTGPSIRCSKASISSRSSAVKANTPLTRKGWPRRRCAILPSTIANSTTSPTASSSAMCGECGSAD